MPKDLVMVDEQDNEVNESVVAVVLSDDCYVKSNILFIEKDKALKVAASIILQIDLGK